LVGGVGAGAGGAQGSINLFDAKALAGARAGEDGEANLSDKGGDDEGDDGGG